MGPKPLDAELLAKSILENFPAEKIPECGPWLHGWNPCSCGVEPSTHRDTTTPVIFVIAPDELVDLDLKPQPPLPPDYS